MDNNGYANYSGWNYRKNNNIRQKSDCVLYSAGVLPYTYTQDGNCLLLLGKDYHGDWSDFGGRSECVDNNCEPETASREFYEETLGAVISKIDCYEKISNGKPTKIISKTLNGSPYYMYLLYIDYKNYSDCFYKITQFLKYNKLDKNKLIEKVSIRWVHLDTVLNCIDKDTKYVPISLRSVFYNTLSNNKQAIEFLKK